MILTEALACLVPTSGYTSTLADMSDEAFHTVAQCPFFEAQSEPQVYRVNKVKRIVRQIRASIFFAKPKAERRGRLTARHALRSSVVLEFASVTTFVNIVGPFRSLALPAILCSLFRPSSFS